MVFWILTLLMSGGVTRFAAVCTAFFSATYSSGKHGLGVVSNDGTSVLAWFMRRTVVSLTFFL